LNRAIGHLALGSLAAAVVSLVAHRAKALTTGGAVVASTVGGLVYAGTGLRGAVGLVGFFLTSSALGRLPTAGVTRQARGATRDAVQVLANGGVPAAFALARVIAPPPIRSRLDAGYCGAVAAAAADTWATEIGTRFGGSPRSILTLSPVSPGASGGVTAAGFLGSIAGAGLVAGLTGAGALSRTHHGPVLFAGVAGAVADSLLGATIQEVRICDICHMTTELPECCGRPTRIVRGIPGVNNDVVNALATATGAGVAFVLAVRPKRP
jgi:uncharacterized protein (TIGR00297 family)